MSQIIKTEAVVLSKINYGETSFVVSLFTESEGKISAIAKGARSPKSRHGKIIDPLNHLLVVFYKKESREMQLISGAEIMDHFPAVKADLEKLKYAYAIIELVKNLLAEHEVNSKLFKGIVRILSNLNSSREIPAVSFGRFFLFILKEIGYEVQIEKCAICGNENGDIDNFYFNFEKGMICGKCKEQAVEINRINSELLDYLRCLRSNDIADNFSISIPERAITLLEKYIRYHVQGFKGIQSLKSFN